MSSALQGTTAQPNDCVCVIADLIDVMLYMNPLAAACNPVVAKALTGTVALAAAPFQALACNAQQAWYSATGIYDMQVAR